MNYNKYFKLLDEYDTDEDINDNKCCNENMIRENNSYLVCYECGKTIYNICNEITTKNEMYDFYNTHNFPKNHRYYKVDDVFYERLYNSKIDKENKDKILKLYNLNKGNIKDIFFKNGKKNLNYNFLILKFLEILKIDKYNHLFQKNNSINTIKKNNKFFSKIKFKNF